MQSPILDLALALGLLITAFRALHTRVLFTGVVFYIASGMLMSLVWVRLRAPDLALAEASLGAGMIGAILLDAARALEGGSDPVAPEPRSRIGRLPAAVAAVAFTAILAVTLLALAPGADRGEKWNRWTGFGTDRTGASGADSLRGTMTDLGDQVATNLSASGVTYPVTAVLLNFRSYDTMLEMTVLFLAAVGSLMVYRSGRQWTNREESSGGQSVAVSPVAEGATRILAPFGVLVGGYLVWRGSSAPGGAFQAGAVIGAIGVLLVLAGLSPISGPDARWIRVALAAGPAAFVLAGAAGLASTGRFLGFPPGRAGTVITVIEVAVAVGVGVTLALLYAGGRMERPLARAARENSGLAEDSHVVDPGADPSDRSPRGVESSQPDQKDRQIGDPSHDSGDDDRGAPDERRSNTDR